MLLAPVLLVFHKRHIAGGTPEPLPQDIDPCDDHPRRQTQSSHHRKAEAEEGGQEERIMGKAVSGCDSDRRLAQPKDLPAGTAPAFDYGNLVLLRVIHLFGDHKQERSQQNQDRKL